MPPRLSQRGRLQVLYIVLEQTRLLHQKGTPLDSYSILRQAVYSLAACQGESGQSRMDARGLKAAQVTSNCCVLYKLQASHIGCTVLEQVMSQHHWSR